METKDIKELIAALDASKVSKLEFETDGFKLKLEKSAPAAAPAASSTVSTAVSAVVAQAPAQTDACAAQDGNVVTSPLVGTFYASSAPDKPALAKVGQKVKKGDTLFIVESMKLMNEIASEYDGTVAEIYAKNGAGVEYGQPIMRIN